MVFVSDLTRAIETAEIAFGGSGVPVLADWRLRECDYGVLNGAPAAEVHERRAHYLDNAYPGGEGWRQAVARVGAFLEDLKGPLCRRWEGRRVLSIGHVATRWALDGVSGGCRLEGPIEAEFRWREGWDYQL